jgi:hypothetical protein
MFMSCKGIIDLYRFIPGIIPYIYILYILIIHTRIWYIVMKYFFLWNHSIAYNILFYTCIIFPCYHISYNVCESRSEANWNFKRGARCGQWVAVWFVKLRTNIRLKPVVSSCIQFLCTMKYIGIVTILRGMQAIEQQIVWDRLVHRST